MRRQCNIAVVSEGRYRLGAVRDARTREERGTREQLAAAVGDARAARARLDLARSRTHAARHRLAQAIVARDTLVDGGSTPARIALADKFATRCRHDLDAALGEELRAEATHDAQLGAVDLVRRILARARADRQVVERHFERWRDDKKKLAERRED
jgi:hypothetical protein